MCVPALFYGEFYVNIGLYFNFLKLYVAVFWHAGFGFCIKSVGGFG